MSASISIAGPLPAIQIDDPEKWLLKVASVAEQMTGALGIAAGTLFAGHPDLTSDLEVILKLLANPSNQLDVWMYFTAFEGAHRVLGRVQAHYPNANLQTIVRPHAGSPNPHLFLQEVVKEVEYDAGVCPLQSIIKRHPGASSL